MEVAMVPPARDAELAEPGSVPVKLAAADTSSAMLAARLRPGELMHEVGTTQVLATLAEKPTPSPRKLTRLFGVGMALADDRAGRQRQAQCGRDSFLARLDRPDRKIEAGQDVGERGQPRDPLDFGIRNHAGNLT